MADLLGTDEFLVNRNDITYTQQQDTLMASLETTDYLLINRAGQTYKITGGELIDSVIDPLELTVVLNPTEGYKGVEVTAIPVVSGGKQPDGGYIFTYQWVTATDAAGTDKTSIAGETGATFTPDDAQLGLYLGCVVSTTDALGTSAEGEAYIGPISVLAQAPVIDNVVISEIYDGANRFTDKEFPYVTTMAVAGEPAPTYEVKAKLSGTTFDFTVKSDAITDVEGGGVDVCETDAIQNVSPIPAPTSVTYKVYKPSITDCRILSYEDGTDEQTLAPGVPPTISGDFSAYFYKFDSDQIANIKEGDVFTLNFAFWYSDTGEANSWTFDRIDDSSSGGKTAFATRAAKYWIILRVLSDTTTPWVPYANMLSNKYAVVDNPPGATLTFPTTEGFDCFEPGDVVQGYKYSNGETDFDENLSGSQPLSNAFNIDTINDTSFVGSAISTQDSFYLIFPKSVTGVNKIEVATDTGSDTNSLTREIKVEGVGLNSTKTIKDTSTNLATNTVIFDSLGGVTFTKITVTNADTGADKKGYVGLRWIKVNDSYLLDGEEVKVINKDADAVPPTITVDGGEWLTGAETAGQNRDKVWSNNVTGDLPPLRPASLAFEGYISTVSESVDLDSFKTFAAYSTSNTGGTTRINFEVDVTTSVVLYAGVGGSNYSDGGAKFNLIKSDGTALDITSKLATFEFTMTKGDGYTLNATELSALGGQIKGIEMTSMKNSNAALFWGIEVDGKLLVDRGVGGDDKLVKETPYDTKLTVASSENLELLTGDVFMTDGSAVPATQTPYKLVTTDIESVEQEDNSYQVTSQGPNQNGTLNAAYPSDFFSSRHVTAYDAVADGADLYNAGYFSATGASSGVNTAHMLLSPGLKVFPTDSIKANIRTYGYNTPVIINGTYTVGTVQANGDQTYGAKKNIELTTLDLTEFFAAGETTITSIEVSSGAGGGSQCGILSLLINGEMAGSRGYTELTFPGDVSTNPDLRYFKPGDVVQGAPAAKVKTPTTDDAQGFLPNHPAEDMIDGDIVTHAQAPTQNNITAENSSIFVELESTTYTGPAYVWAPGGGWDGQVSRVEYIDGTFSPWVETYQAGVGTYPRWLRFDEPNVTTAKKRLIFSSHRSQGINRPVVSNGFSFDGVNAYGSETPVKVISTGYPDSNTMVVDGGEWSTGESFDFGGGTATSTSVPTGNFGSSTDINKIMDGNAATNADGCQFDRNDFPTRIDCTPGNTIPAGSDMWMIYVYGDGITTVTNKYKPKLTHINGNPITPLDFDDPVMAASVSTAAKSDAAAAKIRMPQNATSYSITFDATAPLPGGNDAFVWGFIQSELIGDDHVEYQTYGGEGEIISVNTDDNTILLTETGDRDNRWIIGAVDTAGDAGNSGETGNAANAKNHYVAPASAVPITQDHAWCNLQIVNNKAQVTGIQKEETQFTAVTAKDYSIKFPSVFGTGNAPDVDLPDGTAINVEVKAENEHGSSEKESNTLIASVTRAAANSQLDSNDPADVAKQQAIADAFAAFPSNVNDRRTAIASSLYRLYAGENISADEFQLLEEVVSNAVNAVEPFALDGYYPLYYTAAKADAASSEGTHHTHTINGITYYMPDGGTIYHGNYI